MLLHEQSEWSIRPRLSKCSDLFATFITKVFKPHVCTWWWESNEVHFINRNEIFCPSVFWFTALYEIFYCNKIPWLYHVLEVFVYLLWISKSKIDLENRKKIIQTNTFSKLKHQNVKLLNERTGTAWRINAEIGKSLL